MVKSRLSLHLLYIMHNQKCVFGGGEEQSSGGKSVPHSPPGIQADTMYNTQLL